MKYLICSVLIAGFLLSGCARSLEKLTPVGLVQPPPHAVVQDIKSQDLPREASKEQ